MKWRKGRGNTGRRRRSTKSERCGGGTRNEKKRGNELEGRRQNEKKEKG